MSRNLNLCIFLISSLISGCLFSSGSSSQSSTPPIDSPTSSSPDNNQTSPNFNYANNIILTKDEVTDIKPINTGSAITSCTSIPILPSGLQINNDCSISGSPLTVLTNTSFIITGTNNAGTFTTTLNIRVNDIPPANLSYANSSFSYGATLPIQESQPNNSGGSVVNYSIQPILPPGLTFNNLTGIISGTPTTPTPLVNYTITAENSGGSTSTIISIIVINPIVITNLHQNQILETGFIIGTALNGISQVGCKFDNENIIIAMGNSLWKCQVPLHWKPGTKHTVSIGININNSLSLITTIGIIKGNNHDLNGDGYADLAIGAYAYNSNVGGVHIFKGGPLGPSNIIDNTLTVTAPVINFGSNLMLDDLNNDGYADIVISATSITNASNNSVYIYMGSNSGVSTTPSSVLSHPLGAVYFGWALTIGDLNNDDYPDLIVSDYGNGNLYVYNGSNSGASTSPSQTILNPSTSSFFGYSIAIGDVNGDDYLDLIVGDYIHNTKGSVYLYNGSIVGIGNTPSSMINCPSGPFSAFGTVVLSGDVNGDGFSDVVIGIGSGAKVFVYNGSSTGVATNPDIVLNGLDGGAWWNSSIVLGNINNDEYIDIAIGYFRSVQIFAGSSLGPPSTSTALFNPPDLNSVGFTSVISLSDLNGDGLSDLIVGNFDNNKAQIYNGGLNVLSTNTPANANIDLLSAINNEYFGSKISH